MFSEKFQIYSGAVENLSGRARAVPDLLAVLNNDEVGITGKYVMRLLASPVRCAFTLMVCSGRFNSDVSQD
ncbi:hypothetical protein ACH49M_31555 [Rhodococcus qingshengii]|uniref:hypothetical protein n=1 Tax=Actinomycetes TaxID=1760 RepID=UPI0011613A75|nr:MULTISPECIES: hypothetical protein [Rhodococcus]